MTLLMPCISNHVWLKMRLLMTVVVWLCIDVRIAIAARVPLKIFLDALHGSTSLLSVFDSCDIKV